MLARINRSLRRRVLAAWCLGCVLFVLISAGAVEESTAFAKPNHGLFPQQNSQQKASAGDRNGPFAWVSYEIVRRGQLETVEQLVALLGDDSFTNREAATRRLVEIGQPAVPALTQALQHPDREVRYRAARALASIEKGDLDRRLDSFHQFRRRNSDEATLPGWDRFVELADDSAGSRAFFIELQKLDFHFLKNAEADFEKQAEAVEKQAHLMSEAYRDPNVRLEPHRLASLLLIAGLPDVKLTDAAWLDIYYLSSNVGFKDAVKHSADRKYFKDLLVPWLEKATIEQTDQVLELGLVCDVPATLTTAIAVLSDRNKYSIQAQHVALDSVARFGGEQHLKYVTPLITDETRLAARAVGDTTVVTQLGDLALATAIHLCNEDFERFGMEHVTLHEDHVFVHSSLGFASVAARRAAQQTWFQSR